MIDYVDELRTTVSRAAARLLETGEAQAARRPAPGKWSAKEIVGHLIDSAANNHQRFVRAQLSDDLIFPGYEQAKWVELQHYQNAPWPDLVALWREYNLHIAHLIECMPEATRLGERHRHNLHQMAWQAVAEDRPATLDYFMRDYVAHLQHHLGQLRGLLGEDL